MATILDVTPYWMLLYWSYDTICKSVIKKLLIHKEIFIKKGFFKKYVVLLGYIACQWVDRKALTVNMMPCWQFRRLLILLEWFFLYIGSCDIICILPHHYLVRKCLNI